MMDWLLLQFTERLLRGLKCVSWEKVDVSFHNSKVRSAAHSVIQVLSLATCDVLLCQQFSNHLCLWKLCWSWSPPCNEIFTGEGSCDALRRCRCHTAYDWPFYSLVKSLVFVLLTAESEPGEHVYGNPRHQRFIALMDQVHRGGKTRSVCPLVHLVICGHICCMVHVLLRLSLSL